MQKQHNKTKIVATIGPASESVKVLEKMIQAGLSVARINFSHGTHASNLAAIQHVREASLKQKTPIAIMADLQGPKIRVADMPQAFPIKPKQKVVIGEDFDMDFDITGSIKPGERLLIEDGLIEFKILKVVASTKVAKGKIYCEVVNGDAVRPRKSINLPDTHTTFPIMTEKDLQDLKFALKQDVDYVALSFVRGPEDVENLRGLIKKFIPKGFTLPKIIVKIELPAAVKRFDEILKVADCVMVARGDLGVELPEARVPVIQKVIARKCLAAAKPVIVATQMLDSMIHNPRPTRAEVSDVANAVIDRADAVMLSGESSTGSYPVESVRTMTEIITEVEQSEFMRDECLFLGEHEEARAAAVAGSACELAHGVEANAILGVTESGFTARFLSHQRPHAAIFMLSESPTVCRQMTLLWGVRPVLCKRYKDIVQLLDHSVAEVKKAKLVEKGDKVVVVAGRPVGSRINILEVKTVS
jgi:pyruvate kinase